jgi:hypothetical protein
MQIAEAGVYDIVAGHLAVQEGGSGPVRVRKARLHIGDDGAWHARAEVDGQAPEADDVDLTLMSDFCAWSGRGHIVSRNANGHIEIRSDEALTVQPAIGA